MLLSLVVICLLSWWCVCWCLLLCEWLLVCCIKLVVVSGLCGLGMIRCSVLFVFLVVSGWGVMNWDMRFFL